MEAVWDLESKSWSKCTILDGLAPRQPPPRLVKKKNLSCAFSSGCSVRLVKRLPAECRFQLFFSYLSIHDLKRLPAACRFQLLFFLIVPNII